MIFFISLDFEVNDTLSYGIDDELVYFFSFFFFI